MEFRDVVRRRRMVRSYTDEPVDPDVVRRALAHAVRAPSAGFSQGWDFLVLDTPDDVARFWAAATEPDALAHPDSWLSGMMTAPVLVLPCSSKAAYLDRYAEPDKGWTDRDEARWPMPFWHLDAAMASLLILLTAVDEGLGACFFGVPPERVPLVKQAFGIPDSSDPVGIISLGHPAPGAVGSPAPGVAGSPAPGAVGSPARRRRKPLDEVVHHSRWTPDPS